MALPSLPVDLNQGFESFVRRDEAKKEYLDGLLRAPAVGSALAAGSLVTWRGVLTTLLCTIYEEREGWAMEGVHRKASVQSDN